MVFVKNSYIAYVSYATDISFWTVIALNFSKIEATFKFKFLAPNTGFRILIIQKISKNDVSYVLPFFHCFQKPSKMVATTRRAFLF